MQFVANGEPVTVQHQTHGHQLAVRAVLLAVAPLRLGCLQDLALEVGVGQIVKQQLALQVEQRFLPSVQLRLDLHPMPMQFVHVPVEPVLVQLVGVHAQDIGHGRPLGPVHHRQFRTGMDQPVQSHHLGQQPGRRGQLDRLEDRVQLQSLPHLVAHVQRPSLAQVLGPHPGGLYRHGVRDGHLAGQGRLGFRLGHANLGLPLANPAYRLVDPGIGEQPVLAAQRRLDAFGQFQPVFLGAGIHLPEVADGAVARPGRSHHGFHEQVAHVGLVAPFADTPLDEHLETKICHAIENAIPSAKFLATILVYSENLD